MAFRNLNSANAASTNRFRRALLAWYRAAKRDLPWRRTQDPYRIWLSEIMLQQTRVAAAIGYYERFLARFPTIDSLAAARVDEVMRLWAGLGYYSRARNLHRAAQEIVARHSGEFPRTWDEAIALPGIGDYTAAAILSIAYGAPHAVLDGNVARVLARLDAIRGDLRAPRRWKALTARAQQIADPASPGDWNQAMMELGATICLPKSPRCEECPVRRFCRAYALGLANTLPATRRKRAPENVTLAAGVLLDPRGRTLLVRPAAAEAALFSRMWQFPAVAVSEASLATTATTSPPAAKLHSAAASAKADAFARSSTIAKDDSASRAALAAHLRLALGIRGIKPAHFEPADDSRHTVTFRRIRLATFLARVKHLPRVPNARTPRLKDVAHLAASSATKKIAAAALRALSAAPPQNS
jgi:A/G-specific adenine glycosylase